MRKSAGSFPTLCGVHTYTLVHKQLLSLLPRLSTLVSPRVNSETIEQETIRNEELGITRHLGPRPSITGRIKQEIGDFHVHEIDENGKRVQLTDFGLPKEKWNRDKEPFIHCHFYKEGVEHADAMNFITRHLGDTLTAVHCAGRKDKIAKTTQKMSILTPMDSPITPERLARMSITWDKCKLGNFSYSSESLRIGQLSGNHFKIFVRDLQSVSKQLITPSVLKPIDNFATVGFINYFGPQRFGFNSYQAGSFMLQRKWDQVFDVLLAVQRADTPELIEAKEEWLTKRKPYKLTKIFESKFRFPPSGWGDIVKSLAYHYDPVSRNLEKVYEMIPQYKRHLYIEAFISRLWNRMASFRIQEFGLNVIPGDFVVVPSSSSRISNEDNGKIEEELKCLTEEDLMKDHPYTIYDVLLPFLGSKITRYPNPVLQDYCRKLLAEEGLSVKILSTFRVGNSRRYEAAFGFYRNLIVKPKGVRHKLISYGSSLNLDELMPSDLDILRRRRPDNQNDSRLRNDDKFGVILEFSLPPSTYATIALREFVQLY